MKKLASLFVLLGLVLVCGDADARGRGGRESIVAARQKQIEVNYACLGDGSSAIPGIPGTNFQLARAADFDYFVSVGIRHVRLPVIWERLQPTRSGALQTAYVGYIRDAANLAKARGVTITLDVHNYARHSSQAFGTAEGPTEADFADLWGKLATEFLNDTAITKYDLMNEPNTLATLQIWPDYAQAAIDAIRAVDMNKEILVEGNNWSSAYVWTSMNPTLHLLEDPANKLRFSAHQYMDRDSSGGHFDWNTEVAAGDQLTTPPSVLDTNIGVKRLTPFINWCRQYGFKCNIGEFGATNNNNPNFDTALDKTIALVQANDVTFSYWNAGPGYVNYPFSIQPDSTGRQKTQLAVLTKYTGAAQPTVYFIDGPEYGSPGVASTPFTVSYRGYVQAPITITPSDGGQGGTFTPSTVILQPGFNPTATFTYTGTDEKVYQISLADDNGMTDPTPLNFSTASDLFSGISVQPQNIWWLSKLRAGYNGPAIKLRRASDNATQDFYFTSIQVGAPLDVDAISTWANGSNVYVVTWYDQSRNLWNAGPPNSAGTFDVAAATNADQPQLILSCVNSKPCVRWTSNRMDAKSPIHGKSGLTILSAFKDTKRLGTMKTAWTFVENTIFPSNGQWSVYGGGNAQPTMLLEPNVWHTYFARWKGATPNGQVTYKDGQIAQRGNAGASTLTFPYRNVVNLGYFRFGATRWVGDDYGTIIFADAIGDSEIDAFQASMKAELNTPTPTEPPEFVIPSTPDINAPTVYPITGVNIAGLAFAGGVLVPSANDINYFASRSMKAARISIKWERIQPVLDGPLDPTHLNQVKTVVNNARNAGMDIILDLHNYGAYDSGSGTKGINTAGGPTYAQFADVWQKLSAEFKNNPKMSFDLMNEPHYLTASVMGTAAQAAIDAIRTDGFTGYIHVEGGGSYAACYAFVSSGWGAAALLLTDPLDKLIFQCHQYLDSDSSGTHDEAVNGVGSSRISAVTSWARTNNKKLFLGEYGIANTASMFTENTTMLDYIAANNDVWYGWTAWSGGGYWGDSYFFNLDPAGLTSPWVDKPQMILLYNKRNL